MTRQALVQYAGRLPPLPERFRGLDREQYAVHECMTPVAIYPEVVDGRMYYYADVPQGAPTIRALLAMIFEAVNDQPPETVLAIPSDFVRQVMDKLGLGTREVGLNAMVDRLRRAARQAVGEGGLQSSVVGLRSSVGALLAPRPLFRRKPGPSCRADADMAAWRPLSASKDGKPEPQPLDPDFLRDDGGDGTAGSRLSPGRRGMTARGT